MYPSWTLHDHESGWGSALSAQRCTRGPEKLDERNADDRVTKQQFYFAGGEYWNLGERGHVRGFSLKYFRYDTGEGVGNIYLTIPHGSVLYTYQASLLQCREACEQHPDCLTLVRSRRACERDSSLARGEMVCRQQL